MRAGRLAGLLRGQGAAFGALAVMAALACGLSWRGEWVPAAGAVLGAALVLRAVRVYGADSAEKPASREPPGGGGGDILAACPDPVVTVDPRGAVTAANEAARVLVPALRQGEPLALALRAPEVLEALRATARTGEACDVEYGARKPGDPFLAVRLRPLAGRPASVALFFSDRTRERRVEAMRVDFIATVSHELRTPLASLVGFIDTIEGPARNDPAARGRFLGIMRDQANRMARLVDDLLQLSRVELSEHVAPTEPVDLSALAAQMGEVMTPLAHERGAAILLDLEDGLPPVRGDRDQLLRVVENLVQNALKYGGAGEVALRTRLSEDGRWVRLSVADHGPGIAPEHLPRLTERFYRVSEAESRARGGTGLGLAIVKHVVGRHRGRLSIESALGKGTTVLVQLPVFTGQGRPAA